MTAPHLDDEQLSLLLDGLGDDGRAHLEVDRCGTCSDRLEALGRARDAVAGARVPALPSEVLDGLVGRALAGRDAADVVVPITAARRRRFATPPPAWLLGAVAGIAVLVGIAGFVRTVDSSPDGSSAMVARADREDQFSSDAGTTESAKDGDVTATAGAATSGAAAASVDPEVVSSDLGDQDDPAALGALLDRPTFAADTSSALAAREPAAGGSAPTTTAPPPAPSAARALDRAQCRLQAEAIGGVRFAGLLSTATVRWRGQPAEVLVFSLTQPPTDGSFTRQALVLSRPGCEQLADLRF